MSQGPNVAPKVDEDVPQILSYTKTESCSLLVIKTGTETENVYETYRVQENGDLERRLPDDGKLVYPIGSETKVLIAIALHLIIDVYQISEDPAHARYRHRVGWNHSYVDALKVCSDRTVLTSLDGLGDPTLVQLLCHFRGLPDVNRFILKPDGAPSMSKEEFLELVKHLNKIADIEDSDQVEYSNGNYVLIGILIEAMSGEPLGKFLQSHILDPLGMDHTYVNAEKMEKLDPSSRVIPHVIERDGKRKATKDRVGLSNTVDIAAFGIYSCTHDLGRLYRALFPASKDPSYAILNAQSVRHLFGYDDNRTQTRMSMLKNPKLGHQKWAPGSMVTNANSICVGSRSINRLVLSDNEASAFELGTGPGEKDYEIYYQAGSISAFSCCSYIVKGTRDIVIVMSNTLGQGDATDYVARRLLQDCLMLKVRPFDPPNLSRLNREVNIVEKSQQGSKHFFDRWLPKWDICNTEDHPAILDARQLEGIYTDVGFAQSLAITARGTDLFVEIRGSSERSQEMRLARIGTGRLLICPEVPSIDWFDAWKNLELSYDSTGNMEGVSCLTSTVVLRKRTVEIKYMLQNPGVG